MDDFLSVVNCSYFNVLFRGGFEAGTTMSGDDTDAYQLFCQTISHFDESMRKSRTQR